MWSWAVPTWDTLIYAKYTTRDIWARLQTFFKGPKRCDLAPAGFGTEGEQPTLPHQLDPAARIAHAPKGIAAPTIATLSTSGCAYPHLISPTLRDFVIPAIRTEPPLYFPPS